MALGASLGRDASSTSPTLSTSVDAIDIIGTNSTVFFRETHPGGRTFVLTGPITGDISSTLIGENDGSNNGPIIITSTTGNTFAGQVIVRGDSALQVGRLGGGGEDPLGTGAGGPVEVEEFGVLRLRANTGITSTGIINVRTGGRLEVEGPSSGNTIQLEDGTRVARGETSPTSGSSSDALTFDPGATVTFGGLNPSRRMIFTGTITADSSSTIRIENEGGNDGFVEFNTTVANPIDAAFILSGDSETTRARLAAGGTAPLGSGLSGHLVVPQFATLELLTNTGLMSGTDIIEIQSGGEVLIGGNSSGNRIQMADGARLGRVNTSPTIATSSDIIEIAGSASVDFFGSFPEPRKIILDGPISGSGVTITMQNNATFNGELRIDASSPNALTGQMIVLGDSVANQGVLGLVGTQPLGTMDVEVREFGTLLVSSGALTNQPSVSVLDGGTIRFRDPSGSTLSGSLLGGTGLVRSETTGTAPTTDAALRSLSFINTTVAPGTSAGELTLEATVTTFDTDSVLEIELGGLTGDLLTVDGDLTLTPGSTLELNALLDLTAGDHVIATYLSGSLSGEFGTIVDNLGPEFFFTSIDYGTLTNSQITVSIGQVPEPSSLCLLSLGVVGLARRGRKRHR